jgi:outer membrane autotransporter protein
LELVVNVQQSNLNIDSGSQKIDSTSLMAGVIAPSIAEVLGAKLSAKALVGFANNDGDRKVMTNSLLYAGSRQIKSDYNSTYAVLGTALTKLYPINDRLTADALVGLDLATQHINAYAENDYFAWQGRTLNQLQSRVQVGLDYRFNQNKASLFARVGAERRDLISDGTQDYSINGTNVSFNTNNGNDTYITAQLGIKAQLEKHIQLFGIVNGLHSSDTIRSIQGNIGLRTDF